MRRDFRFQPFDIRFPRLASSAVIRGGNRPILESSSEPTNTANGEVDGGQPCLHASTWLWRPWHAKLWWTCIAGYWAGRVGSLYSPALDDFYTSALAGFLNIAFFPPLALMVLGMGFARAWFEWSNWEFVEPTHEQMFPKRSVGGMRDPYSDPLDPRSGALHRRHFHRHR